ncbi:MAG: carboxymuconolactone decarboxylase family protein [Deltaproteobacteria bacterium]|nr:MAG: carboxymuconolactone decarboxylase family protein [Deltaproteobacteria bacterium]
MSRLPRVNREDLSPENQAVWDRIAAVRAGMRQGTGGPYGVLIHVPALADRAAALEDYFRFNASLPEVDRELVILAAAREMGARYAWVRHEARARQVGVRAEAIETVRAHGSLERLTLHERLLVEIVHSLLRERKLTDAVFARALGELGRERLVETVALVGHYGLIGLVLNAFEVAPPDDSPTF